MPTKPFVFENTPVADIIEIESFSSTDDRGVVKKTFERNIFKCNGIDFNPVEEMETTSKKGVIRGLHFQIVEPQAKLVRCVRGEIFDVAVDLREKSPTFGKVYYTYLSERTNQMLYVPSGFAHGCLAMEDETIFYYLSDKPYHSEADSGILWNDVELNIPWPKLDCDYILSARDTELQTFGYFKAQQISMKY